MIIENLSFYIKYFVNCWNNGRVLEKSGFNYDYVCGTNPRMMIFDSLPFDEFRDSDAYLEDLFRRMKNEPTLFNVESAVIALNSIYNTQLSNPFSTAKNIYNLINDKQLLKKINNDKCDQREVIDLIASVNKALNNREKYIYSFSTKFCSFINPLKYPIMDKYSSSMLYYYLKLKQSKIDNRLVCHTKMGDYSYYIKAYDLFISEYNLNMFTYKEIDKFLWIYGKIVDKSVNYMDKEISFVTVDYIPINSNNAINVLFEIHLFAHEELCDDLLSEELLGHGVNPPLVVKPLKRINGCTYKLNYDKSTTIGSFQKCIYELIWGEVLSSVLGTFILFFYDDNIRMTIANSDANFSYLLDKYFDREKSGTIKVSIYVSEEAGEYYSVGNLRFRFNSKEIGKHNLPHIHVIDKNHNRTASISIIDGKVLAGNLLSKDIKKAKKIISDRKQDMLKYWECNTDGMRVDVNDALGITNF